MKNIFRYIKEVFREFSADNILKYSASLAYYTVFSVAPILLIIISLSGVLFGKEAIQGQIFKELNGLIGAVAALQIQNMIRSIHLTGNSFAASVGSVVLLFIAATTIFGEIQDSLNKIWGLKIKPKRVWWKLILTRLISFSLIISIGIIMSISLLLNAVIAAFGRFIGRYFENYSVYLIEIINDTLSFLISAFLFSLLFKMLPDAKIKWKDVIIGGLFTAVFFILGKLGIGFYLGRSNLASLYGAAGSIIIFMLWVYYCSVILYLGAEFTKVYANLYGGKITPNDFAEWVKLEEKPVSAPYLKNKDLP
ncbi:MAG: YihY/virulence factor BrkB family protein [Ginsengibacter sp.]